MRAPDLAVDVVNKDKFSDVLPDREHRTLATHDDAFLLDLAIDLLGGIRLGHGLFTHAVAHFLGKLGIVLLDRLL